MNGIYDPECQRSVWQARRRYARHCSVVAGNSHRGWRPDITQAWISTAAEARGKGENLPGAEQSASLRG